MASASSVATRCRSHLQIYVVSCEDRIERSKLSSRKQVLGYFLYRHNALKKDIQAAANNTIKRVEDFWFIANIPVKHKQDSIKKFEQLFGKWKGLKKNKNRKPSVPMKRFYKPWRICLT